MKKQARGWLIDDLDGVIRNAWSFRVALIWCVIGAFLFAASVASDWMKEAFGGWQTGLSVFIAAITFNIARMLKQKGTDGWSG